MSDPTATGTSNYDYLRVQIEFQLRTLSPLHCGDGGELPAAAWEGTTKLGDQGHINTVCRGAHGAYIPASTLRGSLRGRCPEPMRQRLFGDERGKGAAGLIRIYDAFRTVPNPKLPDQKASGTPGDHYWNPHRRTTLIDGVALDPVTGTADDGKLFRFEVVPPEQEFACVLAADRIRRDDLAEVLALLDGWRGQLTSSLGRGRGRGWGRISCVGEADVTALSDADLIEWSQGSMDKPPQGKTLAQLPVRAAGAIDGGGIAFRLRLRCDTPLLVNDAGRVLGRVQGEDEAHLEFMRDAHGNALIPASSLRGALRALAWRILATIAHQHCGTPVEQAREQVRILLGELLGTERRRGLIWLGNAVAAKTLDHPQTFSAIDRFTGAAAQETQKIYSVVAADCPDGLSADGHLDTASERMPEGDWWRGLLLLLARDICEGDLRVGWGRARGYGALSVALELDDGTPLTNFDDIMAAVRQGFGASAPVDWVQALHKRMRDLPASGEAA